MRRLAVNTKIEGAVKKHLLLLPGKEDTQPRGDFPAPTSRPNNKHVILETALFFLAAIINFVFSPQFVIGNENNQMHSLITRTIAQEPERKYPSLGAAHS